MMSLVQLKFLNSTEYVFGYSCSLILTDLLLLSHSFHSAYEDINVQASSVRLTVQYDTATTIISTRGQFPIIFSGKELTWVGKTNAWDLLLFSLSHKKYHPVSIPNPQLKSYHVLVTTCLVGKAKIFNELTVNTNKYCDENCEEL